LAQGNAPYDGNLWCVLDPTVTHIAAQKWHRYWIAERLKRECDGAIIVSHGVEVPDATFATALF
jgi:hypothetical protein